MGGSPPAKQNWEQPKNKQNTAIFAASHHFRKLFFVRIRDKTSHFYAKCLESVGEFDIKSPAILGNIALQMGWRGRIRIRLVK